MQFVGPTIDTSLTLHLELQDFFLNDLRLSLLLLGQPASRLLGKVGQYHVRPGSLNTC